VSSRVASPEFVGRQRELAHLQSVVAAARDGRPGFALVGGESGVGKSRLVGELARRSAAEGARVLAGDCVDLGDAELAYAPLVGALRGVAVDELEAILGAKARELAPLLPQLEGVAATATPAPLAQGRMFELLLGLLGGLGEDRPLLLVVEDVHWADRSTRDFLAFLIRNARAERLVVAATYRTDELHRRHPLRPFLAEADRAAAVTRVLVGRFTREELVAQLTGILGERPSPLIVEELFVRAEGNPFFTEELVAAGGSHDDLRLPEDVRDTLMLRIEALSRDAQAVLRVAAAAGPRIRHGLLREAAGLPDDTLVAGLRESVAHHILVHEPESDVYMFRHALLREAIADDLLPGERGPLHAALGAALTRDPALSASGRGVAAELAFHWSAAHDLPAAFTASASAGVEAERVAAFAEANAHFERAAELWDAVPEERRADGPSRPELLRRAAEAAHLSGDHDRAAALVRSALALVDLGADPMTGAALHERLSRYLWVGGLSRDALEASATAVALLPSDAPAGDRARVLGSDGQLLMLLCRGAESVARCDEALALARAAGNRAEEGRILSSLGPALTMVGRFDEGIDGLRISREIAEEVGDLEEMIRAYINLGEVLDQRGHVVEAAEVARDGVAKARQEGLRAVLPMLLAELAGRHVRLGLWDEAAEALDEALLSPQAWGVGRAAALLVRAELDALRGDADAAERRVAEAERAQRQAVGSMWTAPMTSARAAAAVWDGRPDTVRELVERELAIHDDDDMVAYYRGPVIATGVRAEADLAARARATGESAAEAEAVAQARRLLDHAETLLVEGTPPETVLHIATAQADEQRARGVGTPDTWAEVAARWEAFGLPFPVAYARWRQAEATLAAGGARGDVAAVLRSAHATAVALGARPLRREVEALARRARISLDGPGAQPADDAVAAEPSAAERVGLTARELDVLRLAAAGATNREIGETLFISQKTVSVHVSRILAKLDARTRVEAAGLAQRIGLLDDDAPAPVAD
jgi:DNA-binding CsgD family transcriptional regulator/tetratricopeptide (TPR) repeat protein